MDGGAAAGGGRDRRLSDSGGPEARQLKMLKVLSLPGLSILSV